jgi:thioredoxin reductase
MERLEAEVVIVGGGPAGLSAALMLGRCRRRVLLFDSGSYRNAAARTSHGFLTRDGVAPDEIRRRGRAELERYDTVVVRSERVVDAARAGDGFVVMLEGGAPVVCQKLLLATGLVDELPEVAGVAALYGERIFHCPYCDGFEVRDQPLAVYGAGDVRGGRYALLVSQWSRALTLFTDGPSGLGDDMRAALAARGIPVDERPLARVAPAGDGVAIELADGTTRAFRALFFDRVARQKSDLAARLGAELDDREGVCVDRHEATSVPGLYVAGDASRDALQSIVAAGEGASAAIAINGALVRQLSHPPRRDVASGAWAGDSMSSTNPGGPP